MHFVIHLKGGEKAFDRLCFWHKAVFLHKGAIPKSSPSTACTNTGGDEMAKCRCKAGSTSVAFSAEWMRKFTVAFAEDGMTFS